MFEITGDDIARLNDEDLRSLIARLCESEARRRGLSTSCVTWGGSQTAADGGLDVRVAFPENTAIEGFIQKAATGFQVKKARYASRGDSRGDAPTKCAQSGN
jgi:hypothetical protein